MVVCVLFVSGGVVGGWGCERELVFELEGGLVGVEVCVGVFVGWCGLCVCG